MAQLAADRMPSPTILVGVDLVRIADVAALLGRFGDRYAARLFTAVERTYCREDDGRSAERFATRFAAKEATLKVLRPAEHQGVDWRSIEVRRLTEGACEIVLDGAALALARRAGIVELSLSMSHEGDYATATVVAWVSRAGGAEPSERVQVVRAAPQCGVQHRQSSWDA